MDTDRDARERRLKDRVREIAGDAESLGTLRQQVSDLTMELADFAVVIAIDRASNGEWFSPAVRQKYARFFSNWAVLAISRLADLTSGVASVPALLKTLYSLREEGELRRDRWVARAVEDPDWRKTADVERRKIDEQLASGGGPAWFATGPGERGERLSEIWNDLTGRDKGADGRRDEMEEWILDSARRPIEGWHVKTVLQWRHKNIAHQDLDHTRAGSAGFDVYPFLPLARACWAVVNSAHRALLLAEGEGLHGLVPVPRFNITEGISGRILGSDRIEDIEERLRTHTLTLERWLRESETRWYEELRVFRRARVAN